MFALRFILGLIISNELYRGWGFVFLFLFDDEVGAGVSNNYISNKQLDKNHSLYFLNINAF